jgi:hypothetical protein
MGSLIVLLLAGRLLNQRCAVNRGESIDQKGGES